MLPEGLIFENESFIKPGHSVKLLVILPHYPGKALKALSSLDLLAMGWPLVRATFSGSEQ